MNKVYLYTGGIARAHPIYKEFSRYAPPGFYYTPSAEEFFAKPSSPAYSGPTLAVRVMQFAEPKILQAIRSCRVPKTRLIRIPEHAALIHSGQYPLLNRTPWVMDFEQAAVIAWFDRNVLDSAGVKRFFEYLFARPQCKALLPWTTAAKESLLNALDCRAFADKIKVAHLTIVPQERVDRSKRTGTVRLLFCSGNFYYKGGLDAVRAAIELAKQYDVHLTVVSQTPDEVLREFGNHPRITFYKSVSAAQRHDLMRKADIFIHPGHSETYGFVMLEAFSFGLPVISIDGYSAPELVEDGVRGYVVKNYLSWFDEKFLPWVRTKDEAQRFYDALIHPPHDYINRLASRIAQLIEERETRLAMGENAYRAVTEGMFSPARRQEVMREIYTRGLA